MRTKGKSKATEKDPLLETQERGSHIHGAPGIDTYGKEYVIWPLTSQKQGLFPQNNWDMWLEGANGSSACGQSKSTRRRGRRGQRTGMGEAAVLGGSRDKGSREDF